MLPRKMVMRFHEGREQNGMIQVVNGDSFTVIYIHNLTPITKGIV